MPPSMGRLVPAVALALLALPLLAAGSVPAQTGATPVREVLHIDTGSSGSGKMFEAFDTSNLNLYDIDRDGRPELISQNDNNRLYVIDPRTGKVLAELTTYFSGPEHSDPTRDRGGDRWGARTLSGVAVGDVDRDGRTDLIVTNSAAYLTRLSFVPEQSTKERFVFEEKWRRFVDAREYDPATCQKQAWIANCTSTYPGFDGNPAIGDVDGDGTLEIFVTTDDFPGHFSFTPDGELRWMTTWFDGNAGPMVADLDGDGTNEAVYVTDGGVVTAYNGRTGTARWVFEASKNGAWPGSISVSATVADVRGTGEKLVVVGARNVDRAYQTSPTWIQDSHAIYYAIDRTGKVVWKQTFDWGNPHVYMHPAVVDVNGDGFLDFVFMDWNTIGHKPGNWETTGRKTNLFALSGLDGTPIWRTTSNVYWSNKDIVAADVTGDRKADLVVADARNGMDALSFRDLATGAVMGWVTLSNGWGLSRGPVAADLYGDGRLFLVAPVMKNGASGCTHSVDVGCREGAIKVFETDGRIENAPWTNNVLFNEALDGHVAGTAGPAPSPDSPADNETGTPPATGDGSGTGREPPQNSGPDPQDVQEPELRKVPGPAGALLLAALAAVGLIGGQRARAGR